MTQPSCFCFSSLNMKLLFDVIPFVLTALPVSNRHPEPLLWTYTKLPTDGQAVALQPSILRNPHDFYCRLRNPTGAAVSLVQVVQAVQS